MLPVLGCFQNIRCRLQLGITYYCINPPYLYNKRSFCVGVRLLDDEKIGRIEEGRNKDESLVIEDERKNLVDVNGKPWKPRFTSKGAIEFNNIDLQVKYVAGSGPGGQKINKTHNCVQLVHIPTGIRAESQLTRVLHLNQREAERILKLKVEEFLLGNESRIVKKRLLEKKRVQNSTIKSKKKLKDIDQLEQSIIEDFNNKNKSINDPSNLDRINELNENNDTHFLDENNHNEDLSSDKSDLEFINNYDPNNPLTSIINNQSIEDNARDLAKKLLKSNKLEKRKLKKENRILQLNKKLNKNKDKDKNNNNSNNKYT